MLHYALSPAYNKVMKTWKKILSILLSVIAVCCLAAAGIILILGVREDKHASDTLETLRTETGKNDSPDAAASTEEEDAAATAGLLTQEPSQEAASGTLQESSKEAAPEATAESAAADIESAAPTPSPLVENPYKEAFLANEDMAAWLQIPDTTIDYPVMWTPGDENYYLYRDFDGSDNKNGCLILDTDSSLEPLTTNLIIHGHNMRSGAMFGNLTDYEDKEYYENHKQIILYTKECQRNYEVIAVFRSQVYKKSDQVFKFYKFFQADTQEEFDDFYDNIKALSLYDTGVTAEFGDCFLTLSTCVYHVEQGRFVVVAKEVESKDTYLPVQKETPTTQ